MITPVILAGGSGTRLWPLSRKSYPKQFADFGAGRSLFQDTVMRLVGSGLTHPLVLTSEDFRFIVTEQLSEIGIAPSDVFVEPEGRDTAAAILLATLAVAQNDPDGLLLVAPSDHAIPDTKAFIAALDAGVGAARDGKIVTFGIAPDRPETGYGYLEVEPGEGTIRPLRRFVEKPDRERAEDMLSQGGFLWNAGIFMFSARTMLTAFEAHAAELIAPVRDALAGAREDLGFKRLDPAPWGQARKISIDFAIMEKADELVVVPFEAGWTDLGDWEAVRWIRAGDGDEVVCNGDVVALDCSDSLLWGEGEDQVLVGLGLKDVIAVAMPDAVLVADRSRAQDVKKVVEELRARNAKQADDFTRDHRPWGWFESLALGPRFQVKRIHVHPGGKLSLQSHVHRAEHWVVVEGAAEVTVGDTVRIVHENQSIYVPQGEVHRLANPGKVGLTLIEVQTGSYLGEDDIIRHDDIYKRP